LKPVESLAIQTEKSADFRVIVQTEDFAIGWWLAGGLFVQ
jgi:hypothetical protein